MEELKKNLSEQIEKMIISLDELETALINHPKYQALTVEDRIELDNRIEDATTSLHDILNVIATIR